jgi:hypothetical protein
MAVPTKVGIAIFVSGLGSRAAHPSQPTFDILFHYLDAKALARAYAIFFRMAEVLPGSAS